MPADEVTGEEAHQQARKQGKKSSAANELIEQREK
jgi:hypothetical protein